MATYPQQTKHATTMYNSSDHPRQQNHKIQGKIKVSRTSYSLYELLKSNFNLFELGSNNEVYMHISKYRIFKNTLVKRYFKNNFYYYYLDN